MTPAQRWEKRQRIFDKVEQSFNAGKANNSFWDYVSKDLGKIETSPEEWRQALKRSWSGIQELDQFSRIISPMLKWTGL